MDIYFDLLREAGFDVPSNGQGKPELVPCSVSPVPFSENDYDDYAWGTDAFGYSLNGPSDSVTTYALNHSDEKSNNCKKIHRYIRKLRFKPIFLQIVGLSEKRIKPEIINLVRQELKASANLWMETRKILKQNGIKKHFNDIPSILRKVLDLKIENNQGKNINEALNYFDRLSEAFDWHRQTLGRSYFLNMRFVALKLAEKFNVLFPYYTPLTITPEKQVYLEEMFSKLEKLAGTLVQA